ncbi:MAG: hypothetical protein AAGG75_25020 [Bacteroidota bacterium]
MKAATIHELKRQLNACDHKLLLFFCLRLAKFKKENKELLTYLLFEADDEEGYIASVKREIEAMMEEANKPSLYLTKKSVRKTIRILDKFIRYSGEKETEVELRLFLCEQMKQNRIPLSRSRVLTKIFEGQIKKINTALSKLHEDLQYDYRIEMSERLGIDPPPDFSF